MELKNAEKWLSEYKKRLAHSSPECQARARAFFERVSNPSPPDVWKAKIQKLIYDIEHGLFVGKFDYHGGLGQLKKDLESGVFDA